MNEDAPSQSNLTASTLSINQENQEEQLTQQQQQYKKKYQSVSRNLTPKGIFSKIFFTWISHLLSYGNQITISQEVIPQLIPEDKPKIQFDKLFTEFQNAKKGAREGVTLTKVIFKTFKRQFLFLLFVTTLYTILQIVQPILTNQTIAYIEGESRDFKTGFLYFIGILSATLIMSLLMSQIYYIFAVLGFNLSNTLSLLIYNKTLKHPLITEKEFSVSSIINYSQVDAQRLTYLGFQLVSLILTPIQLVVMLFLLYEYIGPVFLVGIGLMIILMIFTLIFTKKSVNANDLLLKRKDGRMKVTEQILQIIKYIKINALEKYFFRKLNKKREQELYENKRVQRYTVLTIFIYWLCPNLIVGTTFIVYIATGNEITPQIAFTVILLFDILQYPIRLLPTSISQILQIWSSVKRIEHYLVSVELSDKYLKKQLLYDQKYTIEIENGNFMWGIDKEKEKEKKKEQEKQKEKKNAEVQDQINEGEMLKESLLSQNQIKGQEKEEDYIHALKEINVKFKRGQTTFIIGDIGSGKSSLLYAILNQMTPHPILTPSIKIFGTVSFCPQKPWIMSGTLKDNILFCKPYEKEKFQAAVYYACLEDDIKVLSKGIETQIGQKGVNLSGGQKARVSLARALYSESDTYLLDDILSAVDVNVGKFMMEKTIGIYLKGKTVILPTHAIHYADKADMILIMENGRIIKSGDYAQISKSQEFQEIRKLEEIKKQKEDKKQDKKEQEIVKEQQMISNTLKDIKKMKKQKEHEENITDKVIESLIIPEDKTRGKVSLKIYKSYIDLNGGWLFLLAVVGSISLWAILSTLSNIEIQHWCEDPDNSLTHIYLYMALAVGATIFSSTRAMILVSSGLRQGRILHKKMIKSLLYAGIIRFYNRVPIGRILNRLSKDLREIDEALGYAVGNLLVNLFRLLSGFAMCLYASTPLILIPTVFVLFACGKINNYYLKTQRECVRLQNISSSPIVSGFVSAVNGVATIRSYGVQEQFFSEQIEKIDVNKRNRISREALESWFSMRLAMLSFVINMGAIGYSIFNDNGNGSLAGLLLAYSLSINQNLVDTIFAYAYLETKMISIQRVTNFTQIQPEPGYLQYCKDWWTKDQGFNTSAIPKGQLRFENLSLRYRSDLPIVLKNINLTIQPGQKIGIAGRTGAGKSTLLSSVLRIVDASEGSLLIDGSSIESYSLKDLRSCITMIDQEPTLIQGSFRQNLDPVNLYTTEELSDILKECNLWDLVKQKGGLETKASNENLSVGERQLLCICRAFLKKSKIVLVDEATANIDVKNDQLIQEIIKTKFTESTVLTVAHRLSTIKNSDKILILGEGRVLEWGKTSDLLLDENSIYRKMVNENDQSYLK